MITLFSGTGIALGVATLLVVLSVMNGMQSDLKKKIIGATAHISIMKFHNQPIENWKWVRDTLKSELSEIESASPYIYSKGLIKHRQYTDGTVIKGIDEETISLVSQIPEHVTLGTFDISENGIILGKFVADRLRAHIGDTVFLSSPFSGTVTPFGYMASNMKCIVRGIFDMGMYEYNATLSLISIENARKLFEINGVSGVEFNLKNVYRAPEVSIEASSILGYPYRITNWMERNSTLLRALQIEKTTMFVILILIIVVAAFNIISSLILIVLGKTREIGILKALGVTTSSIRKIFVLDGLIIGGMGTIFGVILSYIICWALGKYQFVELPSDVYFLDKLPVLMQWQDFFIVSLSAVILSLIAAFYPAVRASSLDPVEAIRNE